MFFDKSVSNYKTPHAVIDTSGGGTGFTIEIVDDKLNYRVSDSEKTWKLRTDLTVDTWQDIVMMWHRNKGIIVYVNGAYKDSENVSKAVEPRSLGTTRLFIGLENKEKGPYTYTKYVIIFIYILYYSHVCFFITLILNI